jgi:hypothetical protein
MGDVVAQTTVPLTTTMLQSIRLIAREVTPPVIWRTLRALKRAAQRTHHDQERDMKIISPEVFERMELAEASSRRTHELMSSYLRKREGTFSTTGTDALTPELAASVEECLAALVRAERAAVNVSAHFRKETRWISPD